MNEPMEPVWEHLRRSSELPNLDGYNVPPEARRAFATCMFDWIHNGIDQLWSEENEWDAHSSPRKFAITIAERFSQLSTLFAAEQIASPIEAQLAAAMLWLDMAWCGHPRVDPTQEFSTYIASSDSVEAWLTPQAQIRGYKADLLLWFVCKNVRGGIVIECDGHAFHERTKEQAARDKRRDRELLAAGYPVMRFTGSEIFNDPVECLAQIDAVAFDVMRDVSDRGGYFPK